MRQHLLFGVFVTLLTCTMSCIQSNNADHNSIDSCETTTDSYGYQKSNAAQQYNAIQDVRSREELLRMIQQADMNEIPSNVYYQNSYSAPSPEDAYDEGYDDGYEQGRYDGANGNNHGYGYDDSNNYYDYYETQYQEGYEEGYDDGYSAGLSEYEEQDEEDEW